MDLHMLLIRDVVLTMQIDITEAMGIHEIAQVDSGLEGKKALKSLRQGNE